MNIANIVSIVTAILGIVPPVILPFVKFIRSNPVYRTSLLVTTNILLIITVGILGYRLWSASNQVPGVPIPPTTTSPLSSITHLMDQEVLAGKTGNVQIVESIYTQDAVVTDAGCYSHPGVLSYYNGLIDIINRYQHLPHFDALQHVNISVTWDPQQPMEAKATADTVGVTLAANGSKMPLVGQESWSFVRIKNQWFISRFTFDLCLQS